MAIMNVNPTRMQLTKLKKQLTRAYVSDKSKVEFLKRSALALNDRIKKASEDCDVDF